MTEDLIWPEQVAGFVAMAAFKNWEMGRFWDKLYVYENLHIKQPQV